MCIRDRYLQWFTDNTTVPEVDRSRGCRYTVSHAGALDGVLSPIPTMVHTRCTGAQVVRGVVPVLTVPTIFLSWSTSEVWLSCLWPLLRVVSTSSLEEMVETDSMLSRTLSQHFSSERRLGVSKAVRSSASRRSLTLYPGLFVLS